MTRHIARWMIGLVLAAPLLPGCTVMRTGQAESPPLTRKDTAKDEEPAKSFVTPDILKKVSYQEEFPLPQYERSQAAPILPPAVAPMRADPVVDKPAQAVLPPKREPLAEALHCVIENKHDDALRHLQAYDADTQDLFLRLLPAMSILSKKKLTELTAAEVSVLHEQLWSLIGTLRPRTPLAIDKMCFCESVTGYGNYKPLPEGHSFAAPWGHRPGELVQLYVEIRNFVNESRQGAFETRLSSSVEIADSRGELIWSYRFEDERKPIRSRTQLHDWFNNYTFHVPKCLPPGAYRLTLQVADDTMPDNRRLARKSVEFRVAPAAVRAAAN